MKQMKHKRKRIRYSKKEQARRNRLRIKLIKELINGKQKVDTWIEGVHSKIRAIIRNPDEYLKKQMLEKMESKKNKDNDNIWNLESKEWTWKR
jgi:hypothetical protein